MATSCNCPNSTLSIDRDSGQLLELKVIGAEEIVGAEVDAGVLSYITYSTTKRANPRFPHTALITRIKTDTTYNPFSTNEETSEEVYHGECRNYKNNKTSVINGVAQSDYAISIPFTEIDIKKGDKIVITERARTIDGLVDDAYLGNLGLTVFWNKINN